MIILLAVLISMPIMFWCLLHFKFPDKSLLPEYLKTKLHNDWPWGLRWVPRRWTSFVVPFPPRKWAGNAEERWSEVQKDYPIKDTEYRQNDWIKVTVPWWKGTIESGQILLIDPVHPVGQWSIQSLKIFDCLPRIPCFFTMSIKVFGRRLHFNIGAKPDVTVCTDHYGDWHVGFPEMSLTFKKISD